MVRAVVQIVVGIGLLLFFVGVGFGHVPSAVIGLVLVVVGLYVGLKPDGVLRKEEVIDDWAALIENAQGNGEHILNRTHELLKESQAPYLSVHKENIISGAIRGIIGGGRLFLVISQGGNFRLTPYQMFVNGRDYGNNLAVNWHLIYRPTFWQSLVSLFLFNTSVADRVFNLDLFDQQDLRAYVTTAHRSVLRAVDDLLLSLHKDPSVLERKSRGFLGIS